MVRDTLVYWQRRIREEREPRLRKVEGMFHKNELNAR